MKEEVGDTWRTYQEKRNTFKILFKKSKTKEQFEKFKRRWEDNIKMFV
jgi:hypothetical protein